MVKIVDLRVNKRHRLRVYIWSTLALMRKAVRKKSKRSERHTQAAFHAPITKIYGRTTIKRRIVAELHFAKNRFGAGTFAHELEHFIIWWVGAKRLEPGGKDWEVVPKLVGDLTNEFWRWFYENA